MSHSAISGRSNLYEIPHAKLCISEKIKIRISTYDFVIANLLCLPEESRQTLAFTTFSPKFLRALIFTLKKSINNQHDMII